MNTSLSVILARSVAAPTGDILGLAGPVPVRQSHQSGDIDSNPVEHSRRLAWNRQRLHSFDGAGLDRQSADRIDEDPIQFGAKEPQFLNPDRGSAGLDG